MNNKELIQEIEASNNTRCVIIDDQIYIDSMKTPNYFRRLGYEFGFTIYILNQPTDEMVLVGEKSSGFKIKDYCFGCYAMKIVR